MAHNPDRLSLSRPRLWDRGHTGCCAWVPSPPHRHACLPVPYPTPPQSSVLSTNAHGRTVHPWSPRQHSSPRPTPLCPRLPARAPSPHTHCPLNFPQPQAAGGPDASLPRFPGGPHPAQQLLWARPLRGPSAGSHYPLSAAQAAWSLPSSTPRCLLRLPGCCTRPTA